MPAMIGLLRAGCFRARLRLVILQLLDEILSVLARELWKCGAGAIAIRRVTRSAYLGCDCLSPVQIRFCRLGGLRRLS